MLQNGILRNEHIVSFLHSMIGQGSPINRDLHFVTTGVKVQGPGGWGQGSEVGIKSDKMS
jgi:hypothetical protein